MTNDEKGMALIREIENRVAWLVAFATAPKDCEVAVRAKIADEALDEYQTKFPALTAALLPQ